MKIEVNQAVKKMHGNMEIKDLLRDKPSEKKRKRTIGGSGRTKKFWSFKSRCSIFVGEITTHLKAFRSLHTHFYRVKDRVSLKKNKLSLKRKIKSVSTRKNGQSW